MGARLAVPLHKVQYKLLRLMLYTGLIIVW